MRKDQWTNRSDKFKLEWSEDKQKWWDDQSDDYKLEWRDDKQKWWAEQQTSTRLNLRRMKRNENITDKYFLPGQQK